jgi:hypothetical protein
MVEHPSVEHEVVFNRSTRVGTQLQLAELHGQLALGWLLAIIIPFFVLQVVAYVPLAIGKLAFHAVTRRPWRVTAYSEHPKPLFHEEWVSGWWRSGRAAKELAARLDRDEQPVWAVG